MLAVEFFVRGATHYGQPGVFALNAQGQAEEAEAKFTLAQDSWQETNTRQIDAAMAQRRSGGKTAEAKTKSKRWASPRSFNFAFTSQARP